MRFLGLLLALTFLGSCGKSNSRAGVPLEGNYLPVNGSNIEGLYMAEFTSLNGQVNGTVTGTATLQRRDDKFHAYVKLSGGAPHTWHQQSIHEGSCPGPADDMNNDGFIDVEEANIALGQIIIPLDANLSSQTEGQNNYPIGDTQGGYFYDREASFESLFADLKQEDTNPDDNMRKLSEDDGLNFEGKVVVIHGAPSTAAIPETVVSPDGKPVHQTLPIACGTLKQVTSIPGSSGNENPAPVGNDPQDDLEIPDPGTIQPETNPEPQTVPTPESRPEPRPDTRSDDEEEDDDRWYDRIIDWWRNSWERERSIHRRGIVGTIRFEN